MEVLDDRDATTTSGQPAPPALVERVGFRPLGTPLPAGFVGLAVATSVVACLNLGWIPVAQQHQVALVLLAFAFPLQALSSVLCFLARDAPTGAGIGVQAGTWFALGLLLLTGSPGSRSATVAFFLFAAAAALLPSVVTSALSKFVPALVMLGTVVRFVLTGIWEQAGGTGWEHAAGWFGLALAVFALYAALASDLEAAVHRDVLPMGRHGSGREAVEPRLPELREVATEPGVRQQL